MDLIADALIAFPRDTVFAAYRDKIVDVKSYIPNIRDIEIKSRTDEGNIVKFVNIWHGGGEIPAAARAIVSDAMLSWTDHATWDATAFTCDWVIETHAFTEAVQCKGRNTFLNAPGGTKLEMRGSVTIDGKKIRGVPSFLASKVGKTVEEFLVARIQPNLLETSRGLERYLEANAGK